MKRKNTFWTTLNYRYHNLKREMVTLLFQLLGLVWIVGMGGLALYALLIWTTLE